MSLELALQENTAALKHLAVLIATASGVGAVAQVATVAVEQPVQKTTRGKKAVEQQPTTPVNADLPLASAVHLYPPNEGDPIGTRYFHVPAHNTVYKQLPGDMDCTLPSATIVTGTEYLAQKADLEKKFATAAQPVVANPAQAATATTASTAPSATAPAATASTGGKTFEDVINKARELHAAQGNVGLKRVLDKYSVQGVQALNGKASNEDLISTIDSILMGM